MRKTDESFARTSSFSIASILGSDSGTNLTRKRKHESLKNETEKNYNPTEKGSTCSPLAPNIVSGIENSERANLVIGTNGDAEYRRPGSAFECVCVRLENKDLWDMFSQVGTEMVITKAGRRMFPPLRYTISGLSATKDYVMIVEISGADNFRYKYNDAEWCVAGKAYPAQNTELRQSIHIDSPSSGSKWMSDVVSFHKLKVTNNVNGSPRQIVLNSLHRYQPVLHILQLSDLDDVMAADTDRRVTFVFPETIFMAVTAYQSEQITQLKIDNNPFAKGFRDPSAADLERTRLLDPELFGLLTANGLFRSEETVKRDAMVMSSHQPCTSPCAAEFQPLSPTTRSRSLIMRGLHNLPGIPPTSSEVGTKRTCDCQMQTRKSPRPMSLGLFFQPSGGSVQRHPFPPAQQTFLAVTSTAKYSTTPHQLYSTEHSPLFTSSWVPTWCGLHKEREINSERWLHCSKLANRHSSNLPCLPNLSYVCSGHEYRGNVSWDENALVNPQYFC